MAEHILTDFIRALRSADVRVSTGETIDAAKAVSMIGYSDRERLSNTLRCVLAKSPEEKATHDRLFDLYFARRTPPQTATDRPPADDSDAPDSDPDAAHAPDMLSLLQSGDEAQIAVAMERAAQASNLPDIRFATQVAYFTQRMMRALGVDRLEAEMMDAFRARSPEGDARAEALIDGRRDMFSRARQHVQQAFDTFGAGATELFRQDFLSDKSISQLDRSDLERMRVLVEKMAKRLAVKHSRRRRKKNRGQLDVRKTLRANAGFDGVPFDLAWKQTKRDRPKIVAICDVSGSVARTVRFLLMLLYSLHDAVPDIHSFAFSGRLVDVGDTLLTEDFTTAMDRIINTVGMSSTDYGNSLSDLRTTHWDTIDRRATVIILGDGRSNYGDPRLDIFRELTARAKRTVWLCPEPESQWGSGDSEMLRYRPFCNAMTHVATIKDLERVIDNVLASYN